MTKYVNNKTVMIAIVAIGAITAILVAAVNLAMPISSFGPRAVWEHDGPPGYFGRGHFGEGMISQNANWTGSTSIESVSSDPIGSIKSKVDL